MMMKFRLTGVAAMQAKLKQAAEGVRVQVKTALADEAARLLAEAQARVPVKTRALRDSGRVEMHDDGAAHLRATIVFGNEQVDYAVEVHENLEARHPDGGSAKFLESVLNEESPHVAEHLAERIDLGKILP
jgi:hypothetical protein